MPKLSNDKIAERFAEAFEDHQRVSRWLRESPRGSHERQVHKNRQWAIKRRMNKYIDTIEQRTGIKLYDS